MAESERKSKNSDGIKERNEMMRKSSNALRTEIAGKNRKITQMEITNKKLQTQNKYLTDLCAKEKRSRTEVELDNEREDSRKEETEGEKIGEWTEGTKEQAKCYNHEHSNCIREGCTTGRHPKRVCKEYNMNKCDRGRYCANKHPMKDCILCTMNN